MGKKVYHDIKGACEYANVDRQTIYNWIKKGILVDGRRICLAMRTLDGVNLINEIDFDNYMIEIGYNPEDENKETTGRPITKEKIMGLNGEETLEYIDGVMKEYGLRPSQKIDTLLQKIEEFEDSLDEADEEESDDEDESADDESDEEEPDDDE